jgi:hypothetical protein
MVISHISANWFTTGAYIVAALAVVYLLRLNRLLNGVPTEVRMLSGPSWTTEQIMQTYRELETKPIEYSDKLPPKLNRRYIITGGNGKKHRKTPGRLS